MGSTYILVLLTQRFLRANHPNPAPSRVLKDHLHPAQGNPRPHDAAWPAQWPAPFVAAAVAAAAWTVSLRGT